MEKFTNVLSPVIALAPTGADSKADVLAKVGIKSVPYPL